MDWVIWVLVGTTAVLAFLAFAKALKAGEAAQYVFVATAIGMTTAYILCLTSDFNSDNVREWLDLGAAIVFGLYLISGAWYYTLPKGRHEQ